MISIGFDYGDRRTGVAVSDASGFLAGGVTTITASSMTKTAEEALRLIGKLRAEIAVVGLPLNMDGSEGKRAETARAFGAMLASLSGGKLPVVFCDERLSTVEAHGILSEVDVRRKKRKKVVDTLAAELILQSYLDEERKKKANSSL